MIKHCDICGEEKSFNRLEADKIIKENSKNRCDDCYKNYKKVTKEVKMSHNKKRNTAFLYEVLILEFAKAAISKDTQLRQKILQIILESFKKDSLLHRELKLYKELAENQNLDRKTAEKILNEVKNRRTKLDDNKLIEEQTFLARKIKKFLSEKSFSNFVPHFRNLATISQIFNNNIPVKTKILLENEVIDSMTEKKNITLYPVDNLVFKSFVKRFNETYSDKLFEEQQTILQKFIFSSNNERLIDFKVHSSKEIARLKNTLKEAIDNNEVFLNDKELMNSAEEVVKKLDAYSNMELNENSIQEILKIQSLVRELND